MSLRRTAALAALGASVLATAVPATTALAAPVPAAEVWAVGSYTPGKAFEVRARCAKPATQATVVGPRGIKTTVRPVAGTDYLSGRVTVPTALKGSWVRLDLHCTDGSRASVVARAAKVSRPTPRPMPAPAPTPAPAPAPRTPAKAALKAWTSGKLTPGATIQVFAANAVDRKGRPATTATVAGPRAMRATLRPVTGQKYLRGAVKIPKTLTSSWIRLTVTAPDGARTQTIVRR